MPRIQILHLPAPPDEYPFAIILDQWPGTVRDHEALREHVEKTKAEMGARAVLVTPETIEVV